MVAALLVRSGESATPWESSCGDFRQHALLDSGTPSVIEASERTVSSSSMRSKAMASSE
jgi:hypothetical protein